MWPHPLLQCREKVLFWYHTLSQSLHFLWTIWIMHSIILIYLYQWNLKANVNLVINKHSVCPGFKHKKGCWEGQLVSDYLLETKTLLKSCTLDLDILLMTVSYRGCNWSWTLIQDYKYQSSPLTLLHEVYMIFIQERSSHLRVCLGHTVV